MDDQPTNTHVWHDERGRRITSVRYMGTDLYVHAYRDGPDDAADRDADSGSPGSRGRYEGPDTNPHGNGDNEPDLRNGCMPDGGRLPDAADAKEHEQPDNRNPVSDVSE